jgi:hypothetical protein
VAGEVTGGTVTGGVGAFGATVVDGLVDGVVDRVVDGVVDRVALAAGETATVPGTGADPAAGGVVTAGVALAPKAALGATIIEHATKSTPVSTAPLRRVDRGSMRLGRDLRPGVPAVLLRVRTVLLG